MFWYNLLHARKLLNKNVIVGALLDQTEAAIEKTEQILDGLTGFNILSDDELQEVHRSALGYGWEIGAGNATLQDAVVQASSVNPFLLPA